MSLFPLKRYKIIGTSMFPALKDGQEILAWRWFYRPKKGDIVVIYKRSLQQLCCYKNSRELVKRIIKIERAGYFVEGDNLSQSSDSRSFGAVLRHEIVGKVVYVR